MKSWCGISVFTFFGFYLIGANNFVKVELLNIIGHSCALASWPVEILGWWFRSALMQECVTRVEPWCSFKPQ